MTMSCVIIASNTAASSKLQRRKCIVGWYYSRSTKSAFHLIYSHIYYAADMKFCHFRK
jgi:hypothetical protein